MGNVARDSRLGCGRILHVISSVSDAFGLTVATRALVCGSRAWGMPGKPLKTPVYRLASVLGELHNRTPVCAVLAPRPAASTAPRANCFAFWTDAAAHTELLNAELYSVCVSFDCVG